ncbi:DUF1109 family protein [Pseudomonas stutzeri]|uniref:Anti-sigma F factor n=1 Tax=Stutzerimonas stutzeri KOS6 TaxID=1218352 RepID=A0A061JT33_STUST|nr:DUF1109 domain-containing protein [Stutzerimonas stutzeri]EWC41515.1 hypothetical protein B597_010105 [Stutzerimonas stutzeri KOS6]MBK3870258.1 DUF1109 family protein [Stutzerimonas stutzeri]
MKTDDLIALLASEVAPVERHVIAKRFAAALLCGLAAALLLIVTGYGIRPDLAAIATMPLFWAKLALPAALLLGALQLATRMARPGTQVGRSWVLLAAPLVVVWVAALAILITAPADARMSLLLGDTWHECLANIALLSIPAFIAVFRALRGLAPTRPRLAGGAAGLLAGSIAALAYSLHCPEMAVPFWALWYLLGMLLPGALGALLGPRLLRW